MSSVTIAGDTSGSVLLQAPSVSGSTTINIAAQSGTLNVGGPAFSAYNSAGQSVGIGSYTKIVMDTKQFDTGGCYNNTGSTATLNGLSVPSYSFCPNVAGYYQISAGAAATFTTANNYGIFILIYKNGGFYKIGRAHV